ncbi:MAG: acyl--CoA ligase, partial [Clostridia bacterium]|nr:acyl--CoA ligase [Clostridia bacterium]
LSARYGGRTALIYDDGNGAKKSCSFTELYETVRSRSEELSKESFRSYGILCDGSFGCVTEIFSSVLCGRRTVLLNENYSEELLAEQVKEAEVDSLYGDGELRDALLPCLAKDAEGGDGKILFFTSGTTSRAKAVVLSDRSLMSSAYNGSALLPLREDDTLLCVLPLDHVFGFVCGLLWGLSCGASVALGRGARHYGDDFLYFRPTAVSLVPALLGFLLRYKALNPELGLILIGAGGCPDNILKAAKAAVRRVSFGYGLTETSSGVALSLGDDPYAMTICPDDTISIADDGEILISAPTCMMEGYWRRQADTEEAVRDGILHTGDLGCIDSSGLLHLTGRKKEMLVLSDGTKLYLPEYEAALSAVLSGAACCVTLEDGVPALIIEGPEKDAGTVWNSIRPVLDQRPRGQQIAKIMFSGVPFPRTASGKIMRWAVKPSRSEDRK